MAETIAVLSLKGGTGKTTTVRTLTDVLRRAAKAAAAEHDGIIPATPNLADVERLLSGKMGRELVLRKALKDARKEHDVILIDCPPALGLLTVNGLVDP